MSKRKDNAAWSWADDFDGVLTEDHLLAAYRLNLKVHVGSCRKNCRTNPTCLSGFGEAAWNSMPEENSLDSIKRQRNTYAGLMNLGNTCYLNCLLQLWFHNMHLRKALYLWDPLAYDREIDKQLNKFNKLPTKENFTPLSCVANLQKLFMQMEFSQRKFCDPEEFCKSLLLKVDIQQDAQEFRNLYMSRLDEAFSGSSNEFTRNVIGNQYRGECVNVTVCQKCKKVSQQPPEAFYELGLVIKGCNTIIDSLDEFFKKEHLTGDNKYRCSTCNSMEDATKHVKIVHLPRVLQFNLERYTYDVATSRRKKIMQSIQFPDVLDMSAYVDEPPGTVKYSLHALLMHSGTSADSGHYYAHINTEQGWHKFNDTSVKKQKQLVLGTDDSTPKQGNKKQPKLDGFRSSTQAYMLVYKLENESDQTPVKIAPSAMKSKIASNGHSLDMESPHSTRQQSASSAGGNGGQINGHGDSFIDEKKGPELVDIVSLGPKEEVAGPSITEMTPTLKMEDAVNGSSVSERDSQLNAVVTVRLENLALSQNQRNAMREVGNGISWHKKEEKINNNSVLDSLQQNCIVQKGLESTQFVEPHVLNKRKRDQNENVPQELRGRRKRSLPEPSPKKAKLNGDAKSRAESSCEGTPTAAGDADDGGPSRERKVKKIAMEVDEESVAEDASAKLVVEQRTQANWAILPLYLKEMMKQDNAVFEQSCQGEISEIARKKDHQAFIQEFLSAIEPDPDGVCEFIHYEALTALCEGPDVPPLDNRALLCVHGRLNYEKYREYKMVSPLAVTMYVDRFGGDGPRITNADLCEECVMRHAMELRQEANIAADVKTVNALIKNPTNQTGESCWISKNWLKNWHLHAGKADLMLREEFNCDIQCMHGKLHCEESNRRLVPRVVLEVFKKYYPNAIVFDQTEEPCQQCENTAEQLRDQAVIERNTLASLFSEKRPMDVDGERYLVDALFVNAWRRYTKSIDHGPLREKPSPTLAFDSLLCELHNQLIYNPNVDLDRFCVLTPTEWRAIKQSYGLDKEIQLEKQQDGTLVTSIDICGDCYANRVSKENKECTEDSYHGARLYVYKVTNEVDEEQALANTQTTEMKKPPPPSKKPKKEAIPVCAPAKKPVLDPVRRSARTRNNKDEKLAFTIDMYTTLKDLKLMISVRLNVMTSDQHLSLNGDDLDELKTRLELTDDQATFINLGVPPDSVLRLLVDEPSLDSEMLNEVSSSTPETGFEGADL